MAASSPSYLYVTPHPNDVRPRPSLSLKNGAAAQCRREIQQVFRPSDLQAFEALHAKYMHTDDSKPKQTDITREDFEACEELFNIARASLSPFDDQVAKWSSFFETVRAYLDNKEGYVQLPVHANDQDKRAAQEFNQEGVRQFNTSHLTLKKRLEALTDDKAKVDIQREAEKFAADFLRFLSSASPQLVHYNKKALKDLRKKAVELFDNDSFYKATGMDVKQPYELRRDERERQEALVKEEEFQEKKADMERGLHTSFGLIRYQLECRVSAVDNMTPTNATPLVNEGWPI